MKKALVAILLSALVSVAFSDHLPADCTAFNCEERVRTIRAERNIAMREPVVEPREIVKMRPYEIAEAVFIGTIAMFAFTIAALLGCDAR